MNENLNKDDMVYVLVVGDNEEFISVCEDYKTSEFVKHNWEERERILYGKCIHEYKIIPCQVLRQTKIERPTMFRFMMSLEDLSERRDDE